MYAEQLCFKISNCLIFFLKLHGTPNGYFILPRKMEHKSEIKADVVGPAPAPSPCKTEFPIG